MCVSYGRGLAPALREIDMANTWLVKTEPSSYAFGDLQKEGQTVWDGITNNTALIHMRAMKRGDAVLVYHTGKERAVVGTARVARAPYPDPQRSDPRIVVVDLRAGPPLPRPVTLSEIRATPSLAAWDLVTNPRLSVMPVPTAVAKTIQRLAGKPG
ncbi:MAG: EVE domain-containing protein [Planctomycetota bacterium]|jgi:predicted RNA-binding protein with PUA-like domain